VYELDKHDDQDLSLLSLLIIFIFLLGVVFYILYITKMHERSYVVTKKITKQLSLEIRTKGTSNMYYCFTHSENGNTNNYECKEKDELNENPFDYYNTLILYLSKNGNFDQNKIVSAYNYSESYVILLDNDNNNFNNSLSQKHSIFVVPSAIYTNSNKYEIKIYDNEVEYDKYSKN